MNKEVLKKAAEKFIKSFVLKNKGIEYKLSFDDIVGYDNMLGIMLEVVVDYYKLATDEEYFNNLTDLEENLEVVGKYLGQDVFHPFLSWKYKNVNMFYDSMANVLNELEHLFQNYYQDYDYDDYGFYLELKMKEEGSEDFGLIFGSENYLDIDIEGEVIELVEKEDLLKQLNDKVSLEFHFES